MGMKKFTILPGTLFTNDMFGWILSGAVQPVKNWMRNSLYSLRKWVCIICSLFTWDSKSGCAPCASSCTAPAYVLEFCEEFPSQDILWIITISTSAHFLKQWWENSKMNFFWCKVVFSQSGKLGWNYFCRFFRDWEFLGRIDFAEFSETVNFGKNYFSRFS